MKDFFRNIYQRFAYPQRIVIRHDELSDTQSQGNDVEYYDPYEDTSEDNPFIDVRSTGFVYETLKSSVMATWPQLELNTAEGAEAIENVVLSTYELFTDEDLDGAKGVLWEACRVIASLFDQTDLTAEDLPRIHFDEVMDPLVSISIQGILAEWQDDTALDFADEENAELDWGSTQYSAAHAFADREECDREFAYLRLTTALLVSGARAWSVYWVPELTNLEYADAEEGDDDE